MTQLQSVAFEDDVMDDNHEKTTLRGYVTSNLPVVSDDDERFWSVSEAAQFLGPPQLSEAQVRQLIGLTRLQPKGKRSGGSRRRHVRVYAADELSRAYTAIVSVLQQQAA